MSNVSPTTIENHRSRERIIELGEVFTPERYVQQMLTLIDLKIWADENTTFFEPSCGHGNIILAILEKRIAALQKKYVIFNLDEPTLCAIANAINTLWAIDICTLNVELSRKRAFNLVVQTLQIASCDFESVKTRDFLAHILCTLVWQIQENETLSALSKETIAEVEARKTKLGKEWIKTHDHKPIDFSLDWCAFYKQSSTQNTGSLLFRRAQLFLESSIKGKKVRGYDEFRFAEETLEAQSKNRPSVPVNAGVA